MRPVPRMVPVMLAVLVLSFAVAPAPAASATNPTAEPLSPRSGPNGATLFATMPAADTGIQTENNYADPKPNSSYKDPRMWADRYREFEVGAVGTGVAIGDYDGDGRPDIFVASKTESCRLFRNLGDWKFEDVTEKAAVGDNGDTAAIWKQGVAFVDVNNDGRLDLYVCRFAAPNLLYLNQGDGTFREEAAARGLALNDASVMGAFCDYDRDGWLDVYVVTNLMDAVNHPSGQRDRLYRNNRDGTFAEVTDRAGISGEGQGHAATWWDYDNDGWPDLYVSNDFDAPDRLYRNNRDGTFTNVIDRVVPHMPYSSMGADLGDVNNDGLIDLLVGDMAATSRVKDHRTMANARADHVDPPAGSTAAPQYPRNTLYLNTGTGRCLEAAELTGLVATDWTWALCLEDLDNDGRLDVFVTNGMHREVHNTDQIFRLMKAESPREKMQIEKNSPPLKEANLAFLNLGDLKFAEVGAAWGLDEKGVSFGAAFGDLDGDGDLDLVYTNFRKGVSVLRNDGQVGHRVLIELRGTKSNRLGVGATVRIETGAGLQVRQLILARGVLSTSEPVVHFGLGDQTRIDHLTVDWPSGQRQTFKDLPVDRRLTITEPEDGEASPPPVPPASLFAEATQAFRLELASRENPVDELVQQPLLPFRQNQRGPAIAVGDLTGSGADDIVYGGTPADPLRFIREGKVTPFPSVPSTLNDGPALIFDADGDGNNDLLVTKAGAALLGGSPGYQPVLWLPDENHELKPAPAGSLPGLPMSVGALAAADFDRDGRLDLFLGGRVLPGLYPFAPRSALLRNRDGRFEEVTDSLAPGLGQVGMVTGAIWSDVDQDGWPDLLLTLEWGGVRYFHNERGQGFVDGSDRAGFAAAGTGWWNGIAAADFNGDGRMDYAVGNVGLNTPYRAEARYPALLFADDFDGNGVIDLVEACYEGDKLYPWRARRELGAAIPSTLKKHPRYDYYARATLGEILGEDKVAAAQRFAATEFQAGVFLSQNDGTYRFAPLPRMAQIAPTQGIVAGDFDGDGQADLCLVQNSYAPVPYVGRFDGGLGGFLRGDGRGGFTAVPAAESGLIVPGYAQAAVTTDLDADGWPDLLVSRNNSSALAFRNAGVPGHHRLVVRLEGPVRNRTGVGALVTLELASGTRQTTEVAAGSGYYSQSSSACFFGWPEGNPPRQIRVRWPDGRTTVNEQIKLTHDRVCKLTHPGQK